MVIEDAVRVLALRRQIEALETDCETLVEQSPDAQVLPFALALAKGKTVADPLISPVFRER